METGEKSQKKRTLRDEELELGDDFVLELNREWSLRRDADRTDVIPELWMGKNVADYVDPDIDARLRELEEQEAMREAAGVYDNEESSEDEEMKEIRATAQKIRDKKKLLQMESREKKRIRHPSIVRRTEGIKRKRFESEMREMGVDVEEDGNYAKNRGRSSSRAPVVKRQRTDSMGRATSSMRTPRDESGLRDVEKRKKVRTLSKVSQRKMNLNAKKGEADRKIPTKMPKHLFAGKRKGGKTSRR